MKIALISSLIPDMFPCINQVGHYKTPLAKLGILIFLVNQLAVYHSNPGSFSRGSLWVNNVYQPRIEDLSILNSRAQFSQIGFKIFFHNNNCIIY